MLLICAFNDQSLPGPTTKEDWKIGHSPSLVQLEDLLSLDLVNSIGQPYLFYIIFCLLSSWRIKDLYIRRLGNSRSLVQAPPMDNKQHKLPLQRRQQNNNNNNNNTNNESNNIHVTTTTTKLQQQNYKNNHNKSIIWSTKQQQHSYNKSNRNMQQQQTYNHKIKWPVKLS